MSKPMCLSKYWAKNLGFTCTLDKDHDGNHSCEVIEEYVTGDTDNNIVEWA